MPRKSKVIRNAYIGHNYILPFLGVILDKLRNIELLTHQEGGCQCKITCLSGTPGVPQLAEVIERDGSHNPLLISQPLVQSLSPLGRLSIAVAPHNFQSL